MQHFTIDQDRPVLCVRAESFPNGVKAAFEKLHGLFPADSGRTSYGISWLEDDRIVYRAAVTALHDGEAEQYGLEPFTIKKGRYLGTTIDDYMENVQAIGETFEELLETPELDPEGYCLEEYVSDTEVRCMVPIKG